MKKTSNSKRKESISGEVLETYEVDSKLNFVKRKYLEEKDLKVQELVHLKDMLVLNLQK